MAKKIAKKNTVKKDSFSVDAVIDGQEITLDVSTGCKTFGSFLHTDSGDLRGKCITCAKKNPDTAQGCFVKTNPKGFEILPKIVRTKNDDLSNCVDFVIHNHDLMTRKAMVAELAKDSSRSEGGWKTMVGAIMLSMKHLENPAGGAYGAAARGILNEGIVDFKSLKKFVADVEDKTPAVVGRSVQYVWTTWKNL